jgi:hypothetical protein
LLLLALSSTLHTLDVAFMKPLTSYHDSALTAWLQTPSGCTVTPFQIGLHSICINDNCCKRIKGDWYLAIRSAVFTDVDFPSAGTTNVPTDSQNVLATLIGSSCDQTQARSSVHTSPMTFEENLSENKSMP